MYHKGPILFPNLLLTNLPTRDLGTRLMDYGYKQIIPRYVSHFTPALKVALNPLKVELALKSLLKCTQTIFLELVIVAGLLVPQLGFTRIAPYSLVSLTSK